MATLSPTNPKRMYSWWWDSHICPKNSRWLQENLADMDSKIKLMIKIIEEDADSFAKRAEMYYRRRPELMNLLEELYRAYRALAERYDHAAGELRQAHRTMAEAFPDQVPLDLDDDLPSETTVTETDNISNTDMSQFFLTFLNTSDQQKRFKDEQDSEKLQKEISSLSQENQELKKKISSVSERSNKAESEVLTFKEALEKQQAEKEAAVLQCQQSSARLSNLKAEISHTQEEFKRLKDEMQTGLQSLSTAEERCVLLERTNQNLHLELDKLKQAAKEQHDELNEKHVELEKLSISVHEEQLKSMQAEMARLYLQKQLAELQEKLRLIALEKHGEASKVKDIETSKSRLEKELDKIQEENRKLDDQNHSCTARIIRLQDEVISSKDVQRRLEEEVSVHIEERKALQQELSRIKEDRSDLERRHIALKEQIQGVNFNVESLQSLAQEVRDGNVELKEIIQNHEGVQVLHAENLKQLERMSEKNADLEKSLSVATSELEGLRQKKRALEDSCAYLNSKISSHQSERAMLVAQIETISRTMDNLLEKNRFLENSLSDANVELESLRRKLKGLEESSQALRSQNSVLRAEKRTLVREVESISETLLHLESRYADLECRHSDLQRDKDSVLDQVTELQELIKLEREGHTDLVQSSKNQFSALQKQIDLLQEEGRRREKQLQSEERKIVDAHIEILILQNCLHDTNETNAALSAQLQKHQEDSRIREEEMDSLSRYNDKLSKGIHSVLDALQLDQKYESLDQMKVDIILQLILHEIKCLLSTVSDAQDVKQKQLLEKSLIVTLLEHFGRELADLRSERNLLKQETQAKSEELSLLQSQKQDLLKISDEFWKEMEARNRKVDELKAEATFLVGQLSELQESRRSLQDEIVKLLEENSSLSHKLYDSKKSEISFDEQYSALLGDTMNADIFNVILRSLHGERTSELQSLQKDFHSLRAARNDLYQEVRLVNKKLGDLELENNHLEQELGRTMNAAGDQPSGKKRLMRRDIGLLRTGLDVDNAGLEKSNEMLREELHKLQSEVDALRSRGSAVDIKSCDAEIMKLLRNIQVATMNAALFKEKVLELIITCESFEISTMVQKEVLKEEITRRNSYVDELKDKLNAVEVENRRLKVDLNGDFTLLGTLQSEVDALEKQTLSLAKDCLPPSKHVKEENALTLQLSQFAEKPSDHQDATTKMVKDMELQKLHGTIKALQKVVTDTGILLEQERLDFNANLQDAKRQIEMLKLREILDDDYNDATYEQMLKDIQLDLVQTSSGHKIGSFRQKEKKNAAQADDKMLGFWGVVGANNDKFAQDDLKHPQSKAPERDKGKRSSSELMIVKELSVDKQELPRSVTTEPHQEWKRKVIDRLSSDAQRLLVLQSNVQELRTNVEASEEHGQSMSLELDSVRAQIREAEGAISQLIDTNSKLSKKAEDFTSADGLDAENIDLRSRSQRKILERTRKVSEKIGRLELELQKVQQMLLKHEEEQASRRTKTVQRRSKVQLVEYLYGRRRDSRRQKRGSPCGCMRAKAVDD